MARERYSLDGKSVLILSGAMDPIVSAESADGLAAMLEHAGAAVEHRLLPAGHNLSQADLTITKDWLRRLTK